MRHPRRRKHGDHPNVKARTQKARVARRAHRKARKEEAGND